MLIEIAIGRKVNFKYGVVKAIDGIGDYTVVEYTNDCGRPAFRAYVKMHEVGVEYASIDGALVGALMHKYYATRGNFRKRVIEYFVRRLGSSM